MNRIRPLIMAVFTSAIALGSAFALGNGIRRWTAQGRSPPPPFEPPAEFVALSQADVRSRGRTLFLQSCAHCHGEDARGDEGPDLHDLWVSERRIATVVRNGIKGEMPSFAKKHDRLEIALLVAYVRSLK